jgi:signal transduction histidine kinase/ActR/RegA family two-component response regulator
MQADGRIVPQFRASRYRDQGSQWVPATLFNFPRENGTRDVIALAGLLCRQAGRPTHGKGAVLTSKIRHGAKAHAGHLALIALVIGLIWTGIAFNLWHERQTLQREAVSDTANFARVFDENITRTVEGVDQTLMFLRDAYQHDPAGFAGGSWASARPLLDDLQVQMALADRDGNLLWSNLGPASSAINVADRPHFQFQQTGTGDELFISKPVLGRLSGKWTIQFTRKLFAPDGSFGGIVVVSLDPYYLMRFYESISIDNGSILLATIDGTVLARVPEHEELLGGNLPDAMMRRLLHATTDGAYRVASTLDQVERIVSARRLHRYPLLVAVGLAVDDVFAPYERNKRLYVIAGLSLTVLSSAVGFIMISQRRSLLASRQALTATLENMSQGIAMIDADGNVPVLNHRAIDLLGLPRDMLGTKVTFRQIVEWQFASGEFGDDATWDEPLTRALRSPRQPVKEYTYQRTRPSGMVLEIRTQSLPDGAMVRTFTDITHKKQNEDALAAARARAAHAERMQVLGQLAGGIAHDFNNVLQAVQGGATLIAKRAADADSVRRFTRMILDATERGASITRRLLAFARRGELRAEAVDAAALLSGLRDVLSHTLGSPIAVALELAPGLPPLLADKGQLETVLVNLATNARDAMRDGGALTFTAAVESVEGHTAGTRELPAGRYVRLSIADTGSGMDETTMARALEPFFSTKPPGQGTGLGLSMAKGFVEQSGGALSIDSRVGRGTTVHLWLPAATKVVISAPTPARPAPVRPDGGRQILLVDDEAMVRETLAASLEDAGYGVRLAADGADALDILASDVIIDVLVTDLSMPGLDGLGVIRKARRQRPDLPAVLLTGYAGHGAQLAVGGSLSGAFALVRKPVTAAQLADRIEALLAVDVAR